MMVRLVLILGLLILAEFYSFVVVRSAVADLAGGWGKGLMAAYVAITAASWLGFVLMRRINWNNMPHMVRNLYMAFVLGILVGKILILLVMLVDDGRRLVMKGLAVGGRQVAVDADGRIGRSVFLKQLALVMGGLSVFGFAWGIRNRYRYQVRKIKLSFGNLPQNFKGLKAVQISDIHVGSFDNYEAVESGVKMIMVCKPDLIFFTGDLVNNQAVEVDDRYRQIFSKLKAPMGVYSVLGNHDYGDYVDWPDEAAKVRNLEALKATHGQMGWRLLMNEHLVFERDGEKIAVVGIENWSNKARFPKYGDMKKATAGLADKQVPFKILLSHDPSHWDAQVRTEYPDMDLTLSGHTHGMQFGVDSKFFKWSPVQYVYDKWADVYQEGRQYLYVNRGFGFIGYPGRLGILPEITLFELS
jgi:uncharacterized protein